MSTDSVNRDLESYFESNWSHTPISWRNVDFDTSKISEWTRFSVLPGDDVQASMGADKDVFRSFGVVSVQVFTKLNSGPSRALVLADLVKGLFRRAVINSTIFSAAQVSIQGESGGWFQVNITCNFYTDDLI